MAGGGQAFQPLGRDVGDGPEGERDHRRFLDGDPLEPAPRGAAPVAVRLDLDPVDRLVDLGIEEAGVVPAGVVVAGMWATVRPMSLAQPPSPGDSNPIKGRGRNPAWCRFPTGLRRAGCGRYRRC